MDIIAICAVALICLFIFRISIDVTYILAKGNKGAIFEKMKNYTSMRNYDEDLTMIEYLKRFFVRNFIVFILAMFLFSGAGIQFLINLTEYPGIALDIILDIGNQTYNDREDVIKDIEPVNKYFTRENDE